MYIYIYNDEYIYKYMCFSLPLSIYLPNYLSIHLPICFCFVLGFYHKAVPT